MPCFMCRSFCNELREILLNIGKQLKYNVHDGSTYICIEGPRFSTRAESKYFKDVLHGDIIGMTLTRMYTCKRNANMLHVDCNSY